MTERTEPSLQDPIYQMLQAPFFASELNAVRFDNGSAFYVYQPDIQPAGVQRTYKGLTASHSATLALRAGGMLEPEITDTVTSFSEVYAVQQLDNPLFAAQAVARAFGKGLYKYVEEFASPMDGFTAAHAQALRGALAGREPGEASYRLLGEAAEIQGTSDLPAMVALACASGALRPVQADGRIQHLRVNDQEAGIFQVHVSGKAQQSAFQAIDWHPTALNDASRVLTAGPQELLAPKPNKLPPPIEEGPLVRWRGGVFTEKFPEGPGLTKRNIRALKLACFDLEDNEIPRVMGIAAYSADSLVSRAKRALNLPNATSVAIAELLDRGYIKVTSPMPLPEEMPSEEAMITLHELVYEKDLSAVARRLNIPYGRAKQHLHAGYSAFGVTSRRGLVTALFGCQLREPLYLEAGYTNEEPAFTYPAGLFADSILPLKEKLSAQVGFESQWAARDIQAVRFPNGSAFYVYNPALQSEEVRWRYSDFTEMHAATLALRAGGMRLEALDGFVDLEKHMPGIEDVYFGMRLDDPVFAAQAVALAVRAGFFKRVDVPSQPLKRFGKHLALALKAAVVGPRPSQEYINALNGFSLRQRTSDLPVMVAIAYASGDLTWKPGDPDIRHYDDARQLANAFPASATFEGQERHTFSAKWHKGRYEGDTSMFRPKSYDDLEGSVKALRIPTEDGDTIRWLGGRFETHFPEAKGVTRNNLRAFKLACFGLKDKDVPNAMFPESCNPKSALVQACEALGLPGDMPGAIAESFHRGYIRLQAEGEVNRPAGKLNPKELDFALALASSDHIKTIAGRRDIPYETARKYAARIYTAFNVSGRRGLVAALFGSRLIEPRYLQEEREAVAQGQSGA